MDAGRTALNENVLITDSHGDLMCNNGLTALFDEIERFKTNQEVVFNRNIFVYWNRGMDFAPEMVKLALMIAKRTNAQYNVNFICDENISEFFPYKDEIVAASTIELAEATFSDLLRTFLIVKYGGVWIDATLMTTNPFVNWLEPLLAEREFFLWKNYSFDDRHIMSWFIAGKTNCRIMVDVLKVFVEYIIAPRQKNLALTYTPRLYCDESMFGNRTTDLSTVLEIEKSGYYPYFLFHYLWNEVAKNNTRYYKEIDSLPDVPQCIYKFDRRKFVQEKFFIQRDDTSCLSRQAISDCALIPNFLKSRIVDICNDIIV